MSFSPQKQSSEDVSPGVRTPIDRSPEASIATPLHGERAGAKKRPRLSGDDDARAELTSGEERVASTSVREIAAEIRVDALKQQARTLSAELAGAILEARRSREDSDEYYDANDRVRALTVEVEKLEREVSEFAFEDPAARELLTFIAFVRRKSRPKVTMSDLNTDTLQLILRKLETGTPKDRLALSAVSKRFREAVRSPTVWNELDLRGSSTTVTDKVLYSIVRDDDAFSSVEVLNLSGCALLTDISVLKVLHKCHKSVCKIDLSGCELLTAETARFIGSQCKRLEELNVTNCKRMSTKVVLESIQNNALTLSKLRIMGTKHLHGRVDELDFEDLTEVTEKYFGWFESINGAYVEGDVEEVVSLVRSCVEYIQNWRSGHAVTLCDHADTIQHEGPQPNKVVTIFPDCGHVMCVDCQMIERRNMTLENGCYVYPCPGCAQRSPKRFMPAPGGFEILVREKTDYLAQRALRLTDRWEAGA